MHANYDPTHRGHGNSPPEPHRAPRSPAAPRDRLPTYSTSIRDLPAPFLADLLRKPKQRIRLAVDVPSPSVTPAAPVPPTALVGADAELVDAGEHLGRVGVDPVRPG